MVKVAKLACCARTAVGVARRLSEALAQSSQSPPSLS